MASHGAYRKLTGPRHIDESRDIAISEMRSLRFLPSREAGFVKPMECLAVTKLPDGPEWVYEIKLDGYRALAINANGKLTLYSRRRKSFNRQYQHVFDALRDMPQNSVVDGKIVAFDDAGRPNFNFLQHSRSQAKRVCYFVFDLLVYNNRDLMQLPLVERRALLKSNTKFRSPRVRIAEYFKTSAKAMLESAAEQGLEGVVAKRKNSRYEAGKRSGAWAKYRLNSGQELVIGWIYSGRSGRGLNRRWVLPRTRFDLCRESAKRICASYPAADVYGAAAA